MGTRQHGAILQGNKNPSGDPTGNGLIEINCCNEKRITPLNFPRVYLLENYFPSGYVRKEDGAMFFRIVF